jgi:uncharacterized protein YdaU (DUF1376 family)
MSERPFMQLYTSDFLGDTQDLSAEYVGSYLLLLMTLWNKDGKLPFDEVKLARIARLTVEEWRLAWTDLGSFFEVEDGILTHRRLSYELQKFARKSAARKEAGRKGGAAKALKDKNPGLAIAKANAVASSRNQNNKGGASREVPTEGLKLYRTRADHEALWLACEKAMGQPVKSFLSSYTFPSEIVAKAKAILEQPGVTH